MTLISDFDTYEFLKSGFYLSKLNPNMIRLLTRSVQGLSYQEAPADHCDAGPREFAKIDHETASVFQNLWKKLASEQLFKLHELYQAPQERFQVNVIRLGNGYELDWHNHLSTGTHASMLIYLFDDGDIGQGGNLEIGQLKPDFKTIEQIKNCQIDNGSVIFIGDCSHPLLMHRATRWNNTNGKSRYIISYAFNSQDW